METTIALTVVLFILQVLDAWTTIRILDAGGEEKNRALSKLFDEFGRDAVLLIKTVAVTGAGYWLADIGYAWLTVALIGWYAYIVFGYNWKSLPKE